LTVWAKPICWRPIVNATSVGPDRDARPSVCRSRPI
jgi:hypothetical protein